MSEIARKTYFFLGFFSLDTLLLICKRLPSWILLQCLYAMISSKTLDGVLTKSLTAGLFTGESKVYVILYCPSAFNHYDISSKVDDSIY